MGTAVDHLLRVVGAEAVPIDGPAGRDLRPLSEGNFDFAISNALEAKSMTMGGSFHGNAIAMGFVPNPFRPPERGDEFVELDIAQPMRPLSSA